MTKRAVQRQLTYRAATLAGLVTNLFFGFMRIAILLALVDSGVTVDGYSDGRLITYAALTQGVITMLAIFGWFDLMTAVYTGDIGTDLLKPARLFSVWMAQDLGRAIVHFWLRGVLLIVLYALYYRLVLPETAVQWLFFTLSLSLSWVISFAWRFLINLAAFWTPNAKGVIRFGFIFSWFFSGFMMPLALFPEWVQQIAYFTPFPYFVDVPVELFLGVLSGADLLQALLLQVLWAVGLIGLCQLVLQRAVRRLVILGG